DFKGTQFEKEIILWGVRWYVAYPISYRQLEEMMGAGCLRRSLHPQSVGHKGGAGGGKTVPPLPAPCGPQLAARRDVCENQRESGLPLSRRPAIRSLEMVATSGMRDRD